MYSAREDFSSHASPSSTVSIERASAPSVIAYDPRAPRATLMGIPSGPAGVVATLRVMKQLAKAANRDPRQIVRLKACEIYKNAGLAPRNWFGEARALQVFVQNGIRYVRDPMDHELVQTPEVTLKLAQGDCDDQSTLLAAMLIATGHPAQFVAVGLDGGEFSHVLVETKIGPQWYAVETILKKPLGWYPPNVTKRYVLPL